MKFRKPLALCLSLILFAGFKSTAQIPVPIPVFKRMVSDIEKGKISDSMITDLTNEGLKKDSVIQQEKFQKEYYSSQYGDMVNTYNDQQKKIKRASLWGKVKDVALAVLIVIAILK